MPLPIGSTLGARPTVRLLDGTGSQVLRDRLIPALVAAGAEISVIGNAADFEWTDTVVAYHLPENAADAEALAAAIGATAVFDDDPDQPIDLTVTIGSDQETS
ncbi:MAG: hypothetical protein GWO22_14140 [Actinobacteria bacterium]|nr:hypothetical protein [Actinomycetota bacterium]